MAVLLKANGEAKVVQPLGKKFSLEELQKFVGGYIEAVRYLPHQGIIQIHNPEKDSTTVYEITRKTIMFANEEGSLKSLPLNEIASSIVGKQIVGDVVLVVSGEEVS
jgi:hypothetical protein